jgi:hypothetical protein
MFMKWLWATYLFCTVFGFYSMHKASELIGPYPLTDGRHSMAFYVWEMSAGLFLLIAITGMLISLFDLVMGD